MKRILTEKRVQNNIKNGRRRTRITSPRLTKNILETFQLSQFRESYDNYFSFAQFRYGHRNEILHFNEYDEYGERDKNIYGILGSSDFEKMEQLLKEMPPIQEMTDFLTKTLYLFNHPRTVCVVLKPGFLDRE